MRYQRHTIFRAGCLITIVLCSFLLLSCTSRPKKTETMASDTIVPGTFGYDLNFLNRFKETLVLSDPEGKAQVVIVPGWQARVMTSTAGGPDGFSFGWINYQLIASGTINKHINAYGGEERLWLGPEGGPFSIYFPPGVKQEFSNWQVPPELDTVAFDLVLAGIDRAAFAKSFRLVNYSGKILDVGIERSIELLGKEAIQQALGMEIPDSVQGVAYQSENVLINKGKNAWTKESGMLSIWMLSMLTPSPEVTVFIPYKRGNEAESEPPVRDDYFGKVPADRLRVENGVVWFKADGRYRSKIGIPPRRAEKYAGSYDAQNNVLTVLWCDLPEDKTEYVNSKWGDQENPFAGDAINAYNDGPVEDGTQMGPFYELESSSPAADLKPGESLTHRQRIFHFEGSEEQLSRITRKIFGLTVEEIKTKFK